MNLLDKVGTIMTNDVITVHPKTSIYEAGQLFEKYNFHHIPVVKGDTLIGMISKSDFLFFKRGFLQEGKESKLEDIRLRNYEVQFILTKSLGKLEIDDKINVALEIFKKNYFHALPVMKEGRLVGIVTTLDIIKHLSNDSQAVSEYVV